MAAHHIRQARPDDYEAVAAFTRETWADRDAGDYIPRIYHEWIAGDGERQRTFVAEVGEDDIAGICQGVLLSDHEAWAQGMRVNPDYRGEGLSTALNDALFAWARERGATVCRNMVFSWNTAGLGGSRAAGFDPGVEFRWAHPEPGSVDTDSRPGGADVRDDPDAAWSYWHRSEARAALSGLALDFEESWAVSELTRERLHRMADDQRVFALNRAGAGTRGMAYRVREYVRDSDGDSERWAEYGVGAWADLDAARTLFDAISDDAAAIGADRTRVLIPETPRHVSDVAAARVTLGEDPDFVLEADLT